MIDKNAAPEAWAMLSYELEDAAEHLATLLGQMSERDDYGEPELRVDLGHVYTHLNRAWNSWNARGGVALDPDAETRAAWSQHPSDLDLIG